MPHKSTGSGIYIFKNLVNGKVYIGQAAHLERKIYEHEHYLKLGNDKATALQRAVNKYGRESFEVSILEYCDTDQLNDREVYYTKKYKSDNKKYGYNIASGGRSGLIGYIWPKAFGEKISKAKKAAGYKMTPEQVEFIKKVNKGKFVSAETREKISLANQGEKHPMFGKHHTDEAREKMRAKKGAEKSYQFGKKTENATSKYFGVCRMISKGHTYWVAYVKVLGVRNHIGASKDEVEAAKMYDKYVIEHGLPNPLNFGEQK